jgi:hypothetical protein
MPPDAGAAGDALDAYLETVPRDLGAGSWGRWRRQHPPPYLLNENRRGDRCGVCGGELRTWLRFCFACHRREFETLRP